MGKQKTVLVVEDEISLNSALCKMLTSSGLEAISAENGQIGLDLALNKHPDLILLDLLMPVMDGLTMLKELKKDTWGSMVPVFILTNHGDIDKATAAINAGAFAFYIKANWDLINIVKKIKETLNKNK